MTTSTPIGNASPEPQSICNAITSSAIFIVATLMPGSEPARKARAWCADVAALTRTHYVNRPLHRDAAT
jgi:putative iron-dependent peroxidase